MVIDIDGFDVEFIKEFKPEKEKVDSFELMYIDPCDLEGSFQDT